MSALRYFSFVRRQVTRQPARSLLTIAGIAVAMFLFCVVQAMQAGVREATQVAADDTMLVVYRENRYCPFSSQLPQYYQRRIESVPGVKEVTPVRILVSNCRASLDVVTFRGVPPAEFAANFLPKLEIIAGSFADWQRRSDAAVVGESLAKRRGIQVGERFSAAGITIHVAAIARSDEPQDRNVAYTHLSFIQEASRQGGTGGVVTQFNVAVVDSTQLEAVGKAIDAEFAHDPDPTSTRPEKAFVARAAGDLLEIVRFAGWLGYGALAAVFALVANAIVLALRDRVKENAILQTLGYSGVHIMGLVVAESLLIGTLGGGLGALASYVFLELQRFSLTMEGLNIEVQAQQMVLLLGMVLSTILSLLASLWPALQASRREIVECFRSV
ncbi:MAG: ABC transporter permease [Planctomycetota bacterium]